jgi:AraC-like DNA-binding protein
MEISEQLTPEIASTLRSVPPRTVLYSLQPIGIGNALVEGIPSYVMRLARAHRLNVRNLAGVLLADLAKPEGALFPPLGTSRGGNSGFRNQGYAIGGVVDRVALWIHALECGTGRSDIRLLSMWPLRNVLGERMFSTRRTWCPYCLQMWRENESTLYEPLLWSFEHASECLIHRRPLVQKCSKCKRSLAPLSGNSTVGHCCICGSWLGTSAEPAEISATPPTFSVTSETVEIARILEQIAVVNGSSIGDIFRRNLAIYLEAVAKGRVSLMARCMKCDEAVLYHWIHGENIPHLGNLLRACRHMGISAARLFDVSAPTEEEIDLATESRVKIEGEMILAPRRTQAELMTSLREALSDPIPMKVIDLAKRLRYTTSKPLYLASQELCEQIAERYRTRSDKRKRGTRPGRRICDMSKLRTTLEQSLLLDPPLSLKEIAKELGYADSRPLMWAEPELSARLQKRHSEYRQILKEKEVAILESALCEDPPPCISEICRRLGISGSNNLRRREPELSSRIDERHKRHTLDKIENARSLAQAALEELPPPPLRLVLERLGLSAAFLSTHFPAIGKQISKRYREYQSKLAENLRDARCETVKTIVTELHSKDIDPSLRAVRKHLPRGTGIGWTELHESIQKAKLGLGVPEV